jgi:hypothetical protein
LTVSTATNVTRQNVSETAVSFFRKIKTSPKEVNSRDRGKFKINVSEKKHCNVVNGSQLFRNINFEPKYVDTKKLNTSQKARNPASYSESIGFEHKSHIFRRFP